MQIILYYLHMLYFYVNNHKNIYNIIIKNSCSGNCFFLSKNVYLLRSSKRPEEKESKSYIITFGMFQKENVLFDTYMI